MRAISYAFLTSTSAIAFAVATPAQAQTPDPVNPERDACQAPADQRDPNVVCPAADSPVGEAINEGAVATADTGADVVVVGSRIRRNRYNSADPVTIVTRDSTIDAGFNSTAQALQSVAISGGTAQIGDTFGGFVVDGGPGVNTIGLKGMGPTRTLVLLNGRRLSPAGTRGAVGAADLNTLPNIILDRIEVLNTGASSVYGSDAVAGVVNIVTLKKFNGLSIEGQVSAPRIGAGTEKRLSILAGTSGDRFSLLGSLEVYDRNRVTIGDLPWARCPTQLYKSGAGTKKGSGDFIDPRTGQAKCFPLEEGGSSYNAIATAFTYVPPERFGDTNAPGFEDPDPGYYLLCSRFRPNPSAVDSLVPGYECVTGLFVGSGDPYFSDLNYRDTYTGETFRNDVISPSRNYTGYLSGTYDTDVLGNGQIYGELLVTRRKSQQNGSRQFTIDYAKQLRNASGALVNNPLLPPELQAVAGVNSAIGIRVFADYGIYDSYQTQDYVKAAAGFRGDIGMVKDWRYDLYASKSWSDGSYTYEQILSDRLAQSLDVLQNADGTFRCRVATGGCVAAPALTPDIVGGRFREVAPEWFDYVTDDVTGTTKFRETTFNATFDGPLFALQGGDAQAVVGVEYRKSKINDVPSADSIRGNLYGFTTAPVTKGSDSVWEAFTEVELPIFRDVAFAKALTINASTRFTNYASYGSGWTYKIGGLYSPTSWLSARGSYGTSYRAPALFEQFLGATTGFQPGTIDICSELTPADPQILRDNCAAQGLPSSFIQNNGVTVIGVGGADAGLKAETSKNLTFGGVLQPDFGRAGRFSLAVDYYRIQVNDQVNQLGLQTIMRGCYLGTQPDYCQFVQRDAYTGPGTGALTLTQTYINVSNEIVKGIDFVASYDVDLGSGKLDIGAEAVRTLKHTFQNNPDVEVDETVGRIGVPKWAGVGHVGYKTGPWYFRWGVDYIGKTDDTPDAEELGFDPDKYDFSVDDYWLHTLTTRYEIDRYSLTAGIRNVFDKKPPKISSEDPFVNTISNVPLQSGWDFKGRTFFINARAKIF